MLNYLFYLHENIFQKERSEKKRVKLFKNDI